MNRIAAAILLPLAAAPIAAQAPEFSADRVRAHVEFLADDRLEGRDAGTRGFNLAADYVAAQFKALGLQPGAGGQWFQAVRLARTELTGATPVLTIGGQRFESGGDVVIGPSLRDASQTLAAPVVFVGFGIQSPTHGQDDYAGLDVRGKYVAYLGGFPKGLPSDVGAHLNAEKSVIAERNGAIGTILLPTREQMARRPWATIVGFAKSPGLSWVGDDGKPYVRTPGLRGAATLNMPAAEALFAGAPVPFARVLDEADLPNGRPRGFALKPSVKLERQSRIGSVASANVVGLLPGSDPALANEPVLVTAHLDHVGVDPKLTGDKIYNGAMDNAAGVATLIEAARAFTRSGTKPKRPILFVALTAEEDGLLGAQYLAKHPIGGRQAAAVVNLDMPVLLYDFSDVIAFGAEHSTLGAIVTRATQQVGIATSPDPIPAEGLFTRSDHYRFVQEGVPSVFLMTGFAGRGRAVFEDFLKTHYHKVSDAPTLPFDWNAGAKFARVNYLIAREIADAPAAPRWYEDSFFGTVYAPAAAKAKRRP